MPEPYIDPTCTALLVIDMQKGFCDPESQMEKAGIGTENQRAILPDVLRLVDLARERGSRSSGRGRSTTPRT